MSHTIYSTEFKTKLVLEALKGDKTINQIASFEQYNAKEFSKLKKTFLGNVEIAMEPKRVAKEYKDENRKA